MGRGSGAADDAQGAPGRAARPLRWLALAVLAAGLAGALFYAQSLGARAQPGMAAPELGLRDAAGTPVSLQAFRGRVVALNFWASWCLPCREETPALESFHRRYGDRVAVLGVNEREPAAQVEAFRRSYGATFPTVLDPAGAAARRYRVRALPETWLIDRDGVARLHWPGPVRFETLQDLYAEVTGESIDGAGIPPLAGPDDRLLAVVSAGGRPAGVLLLTSRGLFRAGRPDEAAFAPVPPPPGAPALTAVAGPDGSVVVAGPRDLFAAPAGDGSRDGAAGRAWQRLPHPAPGRPVRDLTAGPAAPALWAWVEGSGLYAFDGRVWRGPLGDLSPDLPWFRVLPGLASRGALLAAAPFGLAHSPDAGGSWVPIGPDRPVTAAVALGDHLYLATDLGVWERSAAAAARGEREEGRRVEGSPARLLAGLLPAEVDGVTRLVAFAPNGDRYLSPPVDARSGTMAEGDWTLIR